MIQKSRRRASLVGLLGLVILTIASCSMGKEKTEAEMEVVEIQSGTASDVDLIRQAVQLNPLDGYFTVIRPEETKVYILDKSNFEKSFKPAATMNNRPRVIDFEVEEAGAIVLPETEYETEITIDSAYITNDKIMHVIYSVKKGVEKRSFTIQPVKLFTFDVSLDVDSVSFENSGVSLVVPH